MTVARSIDLNADCGEGFGVWESGDEALLALCSSANVACGFHAGDPLRMRHTVSRCARLGVQVGAHPGYPDLVGFGRRHLAATPTEIEAMVLYQIGALAACCRAEGTALSHVKPHGALYHHAAGNDDAARAVTRAVQLGAPEAAVLAPAGSALARAAREAGLAVREEGFLDRAYRADGTLVPRGEPGALITDPAEVAFRAVEFALHGTVRAVDGGSIAVPAATLCVHADTPGAAALLRAARTALEAAGVGIRAP